MYGGKKRIDYPESLLTNVENESDVSENAQEDIQDQESEVSEIAQGEIQAGFIPSTLWCNPDWEVVQSAQDSSSDSDTGPKIDTASAIYVSREFMKATGQTENVIAVPKTFPLSDPPTEGELAEQAVFEKLREAAKKIEGLKMIMLSGLRTTGVTKETDKGKLSIKEIDFRNGFYVCFYI